MRSTTVKAFAIGASLLAACSSSAQAPKAIGPNDIVATVGGASITLAQVDERALQQPASNFENLKLSQALYEARRDALDEIIGDTLIAQEAKSRGMTTDALTDQEINRKVADVSEGDIVQWYQANQSRVRGATIDQVRGPIKSLLVQERTQAVYDAYVATLKGKTAVKVLLDAPRQKVAEADSPALGPATAPVEIIEFSDFQCPYCLRAHPTVKQVLNTYGDRVRFVYRNYPLPSHPDARPAAEAAQCANEQGKFWPYHDKLFDDPGKLSNDQLKQTAASLGLDTARFDACFDSHKYKARVDADIHDGNDAGVSGTPAFFINGRMVSGAQPFAEFKRVIDDELQRGGRH